MKLNAWPIAIIITLTVFCSHPALSDSDNLALNAGFEESTAAGRADGWTFRHWDANSSVLATIDNSIFQQGSQSFHIEAPQPDDARIEQVIPVRSNQWYHFSVWVKTRDVVADRVGANLSIIGVIEHSPDVRGTQQWQKINVWGKTGQNQTELRLAARLGFYGSTTTGQVWFDDIQVRAVDSAPDGAPVMLLQQNNISQSGASTINIAVLVVCALYMLLALVVSRQRESLGNLVIQPWKLVLIGLLALALKVAMAGYFHGYHPDINTFSRWAIDLYQAGITEFYRTGYFADYPPGYMYFLWCVGAMAHHLQLEASSPEFLMVLKLPAILADLIAAWWLLHLGKQHIDIKLARVAAILWLINPLAIVNSSVWGQVDSIFTLALMFSLSAFEKDRFPRAAGWYALAIVLKPQALLLAPLAVIALIKMPAWRMRYLSVASFMVIAVVLILPFAWGQASPWWILSLYGGTLGSYPYLTLNAFNFYALLNANWLPLETTLLGIGVGKWAWLLVSGCTLPILYCAWRSPVKGRYLWAAAAIVAVFFVFGPKMHERYLFPAVLFAFMSWLWLQDRRLLVVGIGFSVTGFINVWLVLDSMTRLNTSHLPYEQWLVPLVSLINVILTGYLLIIGWQALMQRHHVARSNPEESVSPQDSSM